MDSKKWLERLDEAGSRLSQAAWELNHIDELCTYPEGCEAAAYQKLLEEVADVLICCCFLDLPFGSKRFQSLAIKRYRRVEERMNGQG